MALGIAVLSRHQKHRGRAFYAPEPRRGTACIHLRFVHLPRRGPYVHDIYASHCHLAYQGFVTAKTLLECAIASAMEIMAGARRVHHGHVYGCCRIVVVTRRRGVFELV